MLTSFTLNANELDVSFLEKLRTMFRDKQIEVVVHEQDETEYLRSNPANREHLNRVIADIEAGTNLKEVDPSAFE
jgi:hypothetical protein